MMKDTFTTVVLGGTEISGRSGTIAVSKNGNIFLNVGPKADGTILKNRENH